MTSDPLVMPHCCSVVELRQYTTHPGRRDALIDLFDRELVAPQEEAGMHVIGQFTDLDRPDRFVWLRGFTDMAARADALAAFYGGAVWKEHRDAANATMIDSDNVLLLRPSLPGAGLPHPAPVPPPSTSDHVVHVIVYPLQTDDPVDPRLVADALADLRAADVEVRAYVTEPAVNTFPALPVRADENVLVVLTRSDGGDAATPALATLEPLLVGAPEMLRLRPTAGSQLR